VTPTPPLPSQVSVRPSDVLPVQRRWPHPVGCAQSCCYVEYAAICPHGREGAWTAIRDDTRMDVEVDCPCVVDPIEPRFVGLPWTVA
jgi:hypothetical protein